MRVLALTLAALLLAGCPDDETPDPDGGVAADAGPGDSGGRDASPADAPFPDAPARDGEPGDAPVLDAPAPDLGPPDGAAPDADPLDAAALDADPADAADLDASPADAVAPDAQPADAGAPDSGTCGPIAPADLCGEVAQAWAELTTRCNAELSAAEGALLAQLICRDPAVPFNGSGYTYTATAAEACVCALRGAGCGTPLGVVDPCFHILSGPVPIGDPCSVDQDCVPNAYCNRSFGGDLLGGGSCGPEGTCQPYIQPGQPCSFYDRCTIGHSCDNQGICTLLVPPGASCAAGEQCDPGPTLYPATSCAADPLGNLVCQASGRGGASCSVVPCHELYRCDSNNTCLEIPGDGDACALAIDVAVPTQEERAQLILSARFACRFPTFDAPGEVCVQTGPTTGVGTCRTLPELGDACGIGANLSAHCSPGSYCAGLDPLTLAPATSTCTAALALGAPCDGWDPLLGERCPIGATCTSTVNGPNLCQFVDPCQGGQTLD